MYKKYFQIITVTVVVHVLCLEYKSRDIALISLSTGKVQDRRNRQTRTNLTELLSNTTCM